MRHWGLQFLSHLLCVETQFDHENFHPRKWPISLVPIVSCWETTVYHSSVQTIDWNSRWIWHRRRNGTEHEPSLAIIANFLTCCQCFMKHNAVLLNCHLSLLLLPSIKWISKWAQRNMVAFYVFLGHIHYFRSEVRSVLWGWLRINWTWEFVVSWIEKLTKFQRRPTKPT